MAGTAAPLAQIHFDDDADLRWWQRTETVAYGFCVRCGSSMFWRETSRATLSITAGTLDQPTGLTTELALFTDAHGDYHTPAAVPASERGDGAAQPT